MRQVLVFVPLFLCACSSGLPKLSYLPTDPEKIEIVNTLLSGSVLMQRVGGLSCNKGRMGWIPPDQAEAIANLKKSAAAIGATGVFRMSFRSAPILTGCLKGGIEASGMAFRRDVVD